MTPTSFFRRSSLIAAVIGVFAFQPDAGAIQFNVSSIPGSEVVFTPLGGGVAALDFVTSDPDLNSFQIDTVVGGTGSAVGFRGAILSLFEVGPAATITGPLPLIETAPIDGLGIVGIFDGVGGGLAFFGPPASATSLFTPVASVTGLSFGGVFPILLDSTDPDLVEFFSGDEFSIVFSFSLVPGRTLADLIENGGSAAFSGVLTSQITRTPDSGTTVMLLSLGLLGLMIARRRLSK